MTPVDYLRLPQGPEVVGGRAGARLKCPRALSAKPWSFEGHNLPLLTHPWPFPGEGLWDSGTTMLPFLGGKSPQDHLEKRGSSQGLLDGHQGQGAIPE